MAKSKSGGTRSMIRGRVGSDVYSIGKTANGKKQQVVRSLAETVANPQTVSQMRGRMIMSTVMQAQSALKNIIDHSFDNMVGVQANLSEFIRRNYAAVKADVAANPSSGNTFGLNAYQEKGAKQGAYVIADGKAAIPAAVTLAQATGILTIAFGSDELTVANLKSLLGFGAEDYLTLVGLNTNGSAEYCRFHINQSLDDTTVISASNIASVFETDGNVAPTVAVSGTNITITDAAVANCCAFIITRKVSGGFTHSKATLGAGTNLSWNADAALPTYPVGENKYLNGGEQSFSPAPSPTPTPTPSVSAPVLSGDTPFETSTVVTMSAADGAEIRYTTDGSTPSASSTLYSSPVTLTDTTTIKAIAILDGVSSSVATGTYTKSSTPVSGRTITIDGSEVSEGGSVNHTKSTAATVVVTLPAGDSYIGKAPAYGYSTDTPTLVEGGGFVEGANTITIPASSLGAQNTFYVGAAQEGFPQATWLGTLCTLNVVE